MTTAGAAGGGGAGSAPISAADDMIKNAAVTAEFLLNPHIGRNAPAAAPQSHRRLKVEFVKMATESREDLTQLDWVTPNTSGTADATSGASVPVSRAVPVWIANSRAV